MFGETGCDSVMIGRGSYGDPWIFSRIQAALHGKSEIMVTPGMKVDMALKHLLLFREQFGEKRAIREMKKHFAWYIKGLSGASHFRDRIFRAESSIEMRGIMEEARGVFTTIT